MDNPFPGMNPYLEGPRYWSGFHTLLMSQLTLELNDALPEPFEARLNQRLYVEPWGNTIYPDSTVLLTGPVGGAMATRTTTAPVAPLVFDLEDEQVEEFYVEILLPDSSGDEVIAVIELLSPSNKEVDSEGRAEYLRKQRQALSSGAHLLEIDLLRGGEHTVAVPYSYLARRATFDYLYCLHRAGTGPRGECWAFTLREPLPPLTIPLTDGQPDLVFDLQTLLNDVYRRGKYGRFDYEKGPKPALDAEDAAWLDALLREKGLRN
jgi:hypothetical protein